VAFAGDEKFWKSYIITFHIRPPLSYMALSSYSLWP